MTIYVGIGSNLGNRLMNIGTAIDRIERLVGHVEACSLIYDSSPQGFDSDNRFANVVVRVHTDLEPQPLLAITEQIERDMGRDHKTQDGQWSDRVIDIDLECAFDDNGQAIHISTDTLIIPHPRMHERDFVMIPMKQVNIHTA